MESLPDTDAIRRRHARASPGPWHQHGDAIQDRDGNTVAHWTAPGTATQTQQRLDAEYLASTWQDVGELLGEVERLRAELAAVRANTGHPDAPPGESVAAGRTQALVDLMTATVAATGSPVSPGPLDLLPAPLRDLAKADAAAAHDHTSHVAEDAFVAFLEEPTTERAAAAEYAIATLRFEWEVLAAATQRLLADREDDRRIGRRLYDNLSTGSRISLGDVTEWPWLLAPVDPESPAPESAPTDRKRQKQRHARWRTRAAWLAQLGLGEGEPAPVEIIEEVANATLSLLDEVALAKVENDQLRRQLRDRLTAEAGFGPADATHGPVAQERDGRLAVITAVPHRMGGDGRRSYDTEVVRRLEAVLREMTNSGNQLSVRTWTDIAGDGGGS